jgi:hypothetical protein
MRVLICGGRDYGVGKPDEWLTMFRVLSGQHEKRYFTAIIEGGAPGADSGARIFGEQNGIPVQTYDADWKAHGRAAGPIRNQRMIDEGKPDIVIAFPGGRGTADMVRRAEKAGIEVIRPVPLPAL